MITPELASKAVHQTLWAAVRSVFEDEAATLALGIEPSKRMELHQNYSPPPMAPYRLPLVTPGEQADQLEPGLTRVGPRVLDAG